MKVRPTTLAWAMILTALVGGVTWAALSLVRSKGDDPAASLKSALRALTDRGHEGQEIVLSEAEADVLEQICQVVLGDAGGPNDLDPLAACPPCETPLLDVGADDEEEPLLADGLVEECPVCPKCKPPTLPVRRAAQPPAAASCVRPALTPSLGGVPLCPWPRRAAARSRDPVPPLDLQGARVDGRPLCAGGQLAARDRAPAR